MREARGRPRRDFSARSEEKPHHGRRGNPPSRHLWVGNISHELTERELAHHFLQFGDLESVSFQPGRSYAFINFKHEKDSFAAVNELQGFVVGGSPLKIEFAKAEKALMPPREAEYSERSHFSPSNLRARHSGGDPPLLKKSKMNDKDAEPSEVLWIGFPAQLKVDEFVLRKAFSPFGEIEKITAFPGRTYAFVRYRNVMAARRAKESLEGKLFGNPRVHICFSRNESGPSNRERNSINAPPSPDDGPYERPGSFEHFRSDRSPPFIHNNRNVSPHNIPRERPLADDPWDLPEDISYFHGIKKHKGNTTFTPDNELPEYHPLSDMEKVKYNKSYDLRQHSGYTPIPEHRMAASQPFMERGDNWNGSRDNFQASSISLDRRRLNPEPRVSSSKEVWKWEGVIGKGGSSVCRVSCFPVGKPPDMLIPKFIDCTARTSLDMLAKHYYQAANAWVVFFVPANDSDITYYNEFMNYLGEKQRAAVAKLDDKTTMFLVPPSDFSEKVLKVPGKLSISGVVLNLDPNGSLPQNESKDMTFTSFQSDAMYHKQPISSPSGSYYPTPPFANYENARVNVAPIPESNLSYVPQGHDYVRKPPLGPNWSSPYDNIMTSQGPNPSTVSVGPTNSSMSRPMQGFTRGNYTSDKTYLGGNGKMPVQENNTPTLPAEQLAQLTSSLLGQQGQWNGGMSSSGEYKPSENINQGQSGYSYKMSQNYGLPNEQSSSEMYPQGQFGQAQQFHQQQQSQNMHSGQDDDEADPQKRLQATLQLAASLLHQIKQGKGT